jgi:hypothetical protein
MKISRGITCFAIALFASVVSTQAMAIGKGFYVHLGSGSADWTTEIDDTGAEFDTSSDTSHLGVGFVLDTATDIDRLFNYRFQVGYERFTDERNNTSQKLEFGSLVIDQDFGFGIVRNDSLRFWLGPELRLSISATSENNYDHVLFGIGLGPALGINFHTGSNVSLGLKGGYMIMSYGGGAAASDSNNQSDLTYTVDEDFLFFNFAVLWR